MKWQRTALLVVFSTLLVGAATGTVAAQDDGGVEQCDPDSDDFVSCLQEHASAEDVRQWVQKSPDELTDNQVSAVVEVNVSSLNDTAESRINEWRSWSAGGDQPDWWNRDSEGNDTDSSDSEDSTPATVEQRLNEDVVMNGHDFQPGNETITLTLTNSDDTSHTVYVTDGWSMFYGERIATTSARIPAGETRTVTVDAMTASRIGESSMVSAYQMVTVQVGGDVQSAIPLRSHRTLPWSDEPSKWDYVWAFGGSIVVSGLVAIALAAIYIKLKSGREAFNSYDKLHERL